jgi:hypothetical protein
MSRWRLLILLSGVLFALESRAADPAQERFKKVLDGTAAVDAQTGLIWEQEPDRFHGTWMEAAAHCRERAVGNHRGWRIPTVKELSSLVDASQRDPALPPGHPFSNVRSAIYWSGTPSDTDEMVAWHVSFFTGEAVTDQKSQTRRVWCVRDSLPASTP